MITCCRAAASDHLDATVLLHAGQFLISFSSRRPTPRHIKTRHPPFGFHPERKPQPFLVPRRDRSSAATSPDKCPTWSVFLCGNVNAGRGISATRTWCIAPLIPRRPSASGARDGYGAWAHTRTAAQWCLPAPCDCSGV